MKRKKYVFSPLLLSGNTQAEFKKYFSGNACWNFFSQVQVSSPHSTVLAVLFLDSPPALECLAWTPAGEASYLPVHKHSRPSCLPVWPDLSPYSFHPNILLPCVSQNTQNTFLPTMPSEQTSSLWYGPTHFSHLPHTPSRPAQVVSPWFLDTHALCFPVSVPLPLLLF